MCCAFNKEDVDQIFVDSTYLTLLSKMMKEEKENSFQNTTLPGWYTDFDEPKSQAGIKGGLTVILDAHSGINVIQDFY